MSLSGVVAWPSLGLLLVSSALAAPERAAASGPGTSPSFSRDIQPIFDANCVMCHQAAGAPEGLDLEEGTAYAAIVARKSQESGLPRIAPGKPEASYLIRKLEGTNVRAGGSGERMPPTGPLDGALVEQIREWVKAGAKSD